MSESSLEKWRVFDSLSDDLKRNIRIAIVFGARDDSKNAIFVTKSDEVFGLGTNNNGCLGTGDILPHPEPKRIEILCGQKIKSIQFGCSGNNASVFAIASSGAVFAWGANTFGQLGLGSNGNVMHPTKILGHLERKKVVQVACGRWHTLALTSKGEVFTFGFNKNGKLGVGDKQHKNLPTKVDGPLAGRFVTSIACQYVGSVALLTSGEVFAWGGNQEYSLIPGYAAQNKNLPCKVSGLEGVQILHIVSGPYHALALSTEGKIYAWGDNQYGQLGNGTTDKAASPTMIPIASRMKDVAASPYHDHPCAAMSENNEVFIWGRSNGENVLLPKLSSFSSLDEVFAPVATCRSLRPNSAQDDKDDSLVSCLKRFFDDPDTTDIVFVVEGKEIYVHKLILVMRCAFFRSMFQAGHWKESNEREQIIEEHSYDAFYAFLKYFYSDEIHDLQPEIAFELLALAHFYQMAGLLKKCEELIKSGVTVENAALIYDMAILYKSKELEEFSFTFCMSHFTEVIKTDNFNKLNEDVSKKFLLRAANLGALAFSI
ncbi:Hypothetical predicted protein [Cloeon dipterum]|uniref:BTB domain-containing protein n=1 Tax=Cloeon dipterum TaxID=197152 RepID=A0A8S1DSD4_9INSE|nr:Hypothetical predicted protein [Cloeon dipterum]